MSKVNFECITQMFTAECMHIYSLIPYRQLCAAKRYTEWAIFAHVRSELKLIMLFETHHKCIQTCNMSNWMWHKWSRTYANKIKHIEYVNHHASHKNLHYDNNEFSLATSNVNLHILVMDLGTRHSLLEAKWINIDTSNKEPTLDRRILSQMILHNSLTEFNWVVEFNPDTSLQVVMTLRCQSHADLSCKKGSSLCVFLSKIWS